MAITTSKALDSAVSGANLLLHDLFDMAFRIPNYQRPYKWERDQIEILLDDLDEARTTDPRGFYYLGTLVLVDRKEVRKLPDPGSDISDPDTEVELVIYDVLDGQQRLTTLGIIMAVLRDMGVGGGRNWLYNNGNYIERIPPHPLVEYAVRPAANIFWNAHIQQDKATLPSSEISPYIVAAKSSKETSVSNIANAVEISFQHITNKAPEYRNILYNYLLRNTDVSCIATGNFTTAFRMFKVLNARGMPLTEPDIIKSHNLSILPSGTLQDDYAIKWQDWQDNLQEEFDKVFYMLRNIQLRKRSTTSLLNDWDEIVSKKKSLGANQLEFIFDSCDLYLDVFIAKNRGGILLKNLIVAFNTGFMTDDWKDPLLMLFQQFPPIDTTHQAELVQFTEQLYKKMLADWILETPSVRAANVFKVLDEIARCNVHNLPGLSSLSYNAANLLSLLSGDIYGHRWVRALLLCIEYYRHKPFNAPFTFTHATIEHILPQNPSSGGPPGRAWSDWYSQSDHAAWVHKMGNLALLDLPTNQRFKNKAFDDKLRAYASRPSPMFMTHKELINSTTYRDFALPTLQARHQRMQIELASIF